MESEELNSCRACATGMASPNVAAAAAAIATEERGGEDEKGIDMLLPNLRSSYSNAILGVSSRVGFGGMGCAPHLSEAFAHPMSRLFGSALSNTT